MRRVAPSWPHAAIALSVLVADQLSKWWAIATLTQAFGGAGPEGLPFGERLARFLWERHPSRGPAVAVFEHFWHFRYVENPGAAWGLLAGESAASFRTPFFLCVSVAACGFLVQYYWRTPPTQRLLRAALSMVFGGAVGNFLDRARLGYVIDFIDWHWYERATWPTFNVADAAITVGVVLLVLDMSGSAAGPVAARDGAPAP